MSPIERAEFVADVVRALQENTETHTSEHEWIRLAMKAQEQKVAFRRAVIEKTLLALIWVAVIGLSGFTWSVVKDYAVAHGMWKP